MTLTTTYSQAIDRLIREKGMDEAVVFEKLRAHLAESGRLKILPQLLRELRTLDARRGVEAPFLEIASEEDRAAAESAAKAQGIEAKAQINPDLIRGWRLRANGTLTDHSAKRSLVELYRSITV